MGAWHRFRDWPLRAKMAALLAVASLLPMGISTWISTGNARDEFQRSTATALVAQAEKITARLDEAHRGYLRTADRMALIPGALSLLQATPLEASRLFPTLRSNLQVWPVTDRSIRGAAIIDAAGRVVVATEDALQGADLAHRSVVQRALAGESAISDVYLDEPAVGGGATVAYLSPVHAGERVVGAAAIWVDASTVTSVMHEANDGAGAGSFGILFDGSGIRIAHSFLDDLVFRPGRRLPEAQIAALVAERRFGDRTRALLEDVREVSWHERLTQPEPADAPVFRGFAPGNGQWNYVAARRCATVNWTVYYLMPEAVLAATMERMVRQKLLLAALIMLSALLAGALFAAVMLRPVRRLTEMARAIGAGQADARVKVDRRDELGELGETFNSMAERLQQQSEALRRESADQYRKLFQTMSEGFCTIEVLFDAAGHPVDFVYLETNEVFEARSGLRNVVGRRRSEVIPELDSSWIRLYGRVALTGEPVQLEDEVKPLGRHFDVRAYRVGGADSRRVAVLFNDITDRRRAQVRQQAQLESLSLLHQITRAIGERQDLGSIFQVVVRALEERLPADFCCICRYEPEQGRLKVASVGEHGRSRAEHMGLTEQEYVAIDENGLSRCVQGKLVHEPDVGAVAFPFPQRLAAGGLRALVAAPLLVESRVFGVLVAARAHGAFTSAECEFLRQLSEHVALAAHQAQLYEALQAAYEDLRQTQQAVLQQERLRALGQMASGIAHDINNAISPISLYADSLIERETGLSEQGRTQLDTIQRAIQDVAATVARMREFYRVREPERDLLPVQLNELVPQVADLTRPRWNAMALQRGATIRLHTVLQPGLPLVRGAANEIREALTNLVFNAVDAMTAGGDLTLRTFITPAGLVGIEVGDTGIGMDEDARRRCLEPFFTTKGERGTGLGLAMVYGMAQRHGAEVEIDSKPGAGTRVRLLFRAESSAARQVDAAPVVVPRGLRILLVDDDPVLLRSLRETLESDGHIVMAAPGGQEGIDLARATFAAGRSFSIAFTDLGMPGVDGREVARVLKSLAPRMPVVMLTGWGQRMVSEGEHPADVDLVLGKPPKLRDLREALARFC